MNVLHKLRRKKDRTATTTAQAAPEAAKADEERARDDDATVLTNSFASLSVMMQSSNTMNEHSLSSSIATANSMKAQRDDLCNYKLQKHEHDCFGYLQFHALVPCLRDVPTELAMVSGKPIFYIKADYPNGDGVDVGGDIFSHPLLQEVLESHFIAVSVIPQGARPEQQDVPQDVPQDDDDDDRATTPTPTRVKGKLRISQVGILDEFGEDLVQPISYCELSRLSIVKAIVEALRAKQQPIPKYVLVLAEETLMGHDDDRMNERRAWFGMDDVAAAEAEFRELYGVQATRVGSLLDRNEKVVEVLYNSRLTSFSALVRLALTGVPGETPTVFCQSNDERMAARVEAAKLAALETTSSLQVVVEYVGCTTFDASHDLTALQETPMRFVPLTELQSMKANRLIQEGRFDEAMHLLSPRQGHILMEATRKGENDFYDVAGFPILDAWISVSNKKIPMSRKRRSDADDWEPDSEPVVYTLNEAM